MGGGAWGKNQELEGGTMGGGRTKTWGTLDLHLTGVGVETDIPFSHE